MTRFRLLMVALLTALLVGISGVSAQAATDYRVCYQNGGTLYLDHDSTTSILFYSSGLSYNMCGYKSMPPNYGSWWWSNSKDVDAFYVGVGYRCVSQWGYNYYGNVNGTWFWFVDDNVKLALTCRKQLVGSYIVNRDSGNSPEAVPGRTP